MNKQTQFPKHMQPFKIGSDILDLIDILKKYNIPSKQALAVVKFYAHPNTILPK